MGSLDENQESQPPYPLAVAPSEKCICYRGKTVKTGTKFIIRDTAQQVGEHTEKQLVQLRQKQGRDGHPERKGVGIPPNKEEPSKEAVKSLI